MRKMRQGWPQGVVLTTSSRGRQGGTALRSACAFSQFGSICSVLSCRLRHSSIIHRTLNLHKGDKLFYNLMEVCLTKLIAVAVRELCTATVNIAKYVSKKNETPLMKWDTTVSNPQ